MRDAADRERIERLLATLGRRIKAEHTLYLVGGSTAVIEGWRQSTLDVDVRPEPDSDEILRAFSELKEELDINIEPASPLDFLPPLTGWRERSPYIAQHGHVQVRHMDFRLQALAKLERGSELDLKDADAILRRRLITPQDLREGLEEIQSALYRFPAVDARAFTARVLRFIDGLAAG